MQRPDPALAAALAQAATQHGAISYRQALAAGLTEARLRTLARSGDWASPVRGAYIVPGSGSAGRSHAALLACPEGVLCGVSAARAYGLPGVSSASSGDVHLLLPPAMRRASRRGIVIHSTRTGFEIVTLDGLPATDLGRTLTDCVLWSSREEAVSLLDAVLHVGRLSPAYLPSLADDVARRYRGRTRADWCALADGLSESALETRLRLVLIDAGLAPESIQHPVREGTRLVARLDFAWPSIKLAVEADGVGPHQQPSALLRDRRRQNELLGLGWLLLRFTWPDVTRHPGYVTALVSRHLRGEVGNQS